jgi:hypothetical protein
LSKFHHGTKLWASQNIFAGRFNFGFPRMWPYPWQNFLYRPQAPAWQASPWGHSPSSLAPCVVPMRLSRIDQHIKDEPCAKQRALLGVCSRRFSRVSHFSAFLEVSELRPQFFCSPLVSFQTLYEMKPELSAPNPPATELHI